MKRRDAERRLDGILDRLREELDDPGDDPPPGAVISLPRGKRLRCWAARPRDRTAMAV